MKKNMVSKIVKSLAAILAVAALSTGCGGKSGAVTIGINQFAEHPSLDNCVAGFKEGLKQEGYVEGQNLAFDFQNAQADGSKANTIASTFVSKKYNLLCGVATPSAQACFNATQDKNIPVVFSACSDPLKAGIVKALEKPEMNCTGTSDTLQVEAQLKMIRAFLPEAKKIGILYTTSEVNSDTQIQQYQQAAGAYGFEIVTQGVNTSNDIPMAADSLLSQVDCLTNLTDNTVVQSLSIIVEKANAKKISVFGSEEEQLKKGCLATEGIDYFALGVDTGKIAARILKGEKAGEIPVSVAQTSKPFVNNKAAQLLGIAVPVDYAAADVVDSE